MKRTICTSVSQRTSTSSSTSFILLRRRSPPFGFVSGNSKYFNTDSAFGCIVLLPLTTPRSVFQDGTPHHNKLHENALCREYFWRIISVMNPPEFAISLTVLISYRFAEIFGVRWWNPPIRTSFPRYSTPLNWLWLYTDRRGHLPPLLHLWLFVEYIPENCSHAQHCHIDSFAFASSVESSPLRLDSIDSFSSVY